MYSGGMGSRDDLTSSAVVMPRGLPLKYSRSTPGLEIGLKLGLLVRSILPPIQWYLRPFSSSTHWTHLDCIFLGTCRVKASWAS